MKTKRTAPVSMTRFAAITSFVALTALLTACTGALIPLQPQTQGGGVIFNLTLPGDTPQDSQGSRVLTDGPDALYLTATLDGGTPFTATLSFTQNGSMVTTGFVHLEPGTWNFSVDGKRNGRTLCRATASGKTIGAETLTVDLVLYEVQGDIEVSITVPLFPGDALVSVQAMATNESGMPASADVRLDGLIQPASGTWIATAVILDLGSGSWDVYAYATYASGAVRVGAAAVTIQETMATPASISVSTDPAARTVRFIGIHEDIQDVLWSTARDPNTAGVHFQLESGTHNLVRGFDLPAGALVEGGYASAGVKGSPTTLVLRAPGSSSVSDWEASIRSWGGRVGIIVRNLTVDANGKPNPLHFQNQSIASLENITLMNSGNEDRNGDGIPETDGAALRNGRRALDVNNSTVRLLDCVLDGGINAWSSPFAGWSVSVIGTGTAPNFTSVVSGGVSSIAFMPFKAVNTKFEFVPVEGWADDAGYKGFNTMVSSSSQLSLDGCMVSGKATGTMSTGQFTITPLTVHVMLSGSTNLVVNTAIQALIGPNAVDIPDAGVVGMNVDFQKPGSLRMDGCTVAVTDLPSFTSGFGTKFSNNILLWLHTAFANGSDAHIEIVNNQFTNYARPVAGNEVTGFIFIEENTGDGLGGTEAVPVDSASMDIFTGNTLSLPSDWPASWNWWVDRHRDAGTPENPSTYVRYNDADFTNAYGPGSTDPNHKDNILNLYATGTLGVSFE